MLIDVAELDSAITGARAAGARADALAVAEAIMTQAIAVQRRQTVGVAKVYGRLRARASARRRHTAALGALKDAGTQLTRALEDLRQRRQSDLLDMCVVRAGDAIEEARAAGCDEADVAAHAALHADSLHASQALAQARRRLEAASQDAIDAIAQLQRHSDGSCREIAASLAAALEAAEAAHADPMEIAAERALHADLNEFGAQRHAAERRLAAALAALATDDLEAAIRAARRARVFEEVVIGAEQRLRATRAAAAVDRASTRVEAQLGKMRQSRRPERLTVALVELETALAEASAAGMDDEYVLGPAQAVGETAREALSQRLAAQERLEQALRNVSAVSDALRQGGGDGFDARLSRVAGLTHAAKELEEALIDASETYVVEALLQEAQAALARARDQVRRFV